MSSHSFVDPVSQRSCVVHFGEAPGIEHPDCEHRAEVVPELDAFFCRECRWNGRISGAWFLDLLKAERPSPDPRVAVEHPTVNGPDGREPVESLLHVTCSSCGEVTDWESTTEGDRHRLQALAKAHANEQHEGLVEAVGWAR